MAGWGKRMLMFWKGSGRRYWGSSVDVEIMLELEIREVIKVHSSDGVDEGGCW